MTALTRFVLRHKVLVALFWVAVAAVGVMTIIGTTHRMTNNSASCRCPPGRRPT
jgi:uncharacterized membrane protein YdfJ with MMPL/SSD domain